MWAKNGKIYLAETLPRIDDVIPSEAINNKIFIDDCSNDNTPKIARENGWTVYTGKGCGIGAAASLALSKVETERFMSFEQDVFLSKNWFDEISLLLDNPKVAVAQGWRVATEKTLKFFDELAIKTVHNIYTIDNNIYKTNIVRAAGGFPSNVFYCVDGILKANIELNGYHWVCKTSVISQHLKKHSTITEAKRIYKMTKEIAKINKLGILTADDITKSKKHNMLAKFIKSPVYGIGLSLWKKNPMLSIYYTLLRFYMFKAFIEA